MVHRSGAGGGVQTINGISGPNAVLGASDIPFAGALLPSTAATVEDQLVHGQTWLGTARVFWNGPTLDIIAPVGAGTTHSIAQSVIVTPPISGAPIFVASGRDIDFPHPGVLTAIGRGKAVLIGDIDADFLTGEVNLANVVVGNTNAGASAQDMSATSPSGRTLVMDSVVYVGANAGSVTNATGITAFFSCAFAPPPAPSVKGITFDGTIGNIVATPSFAVAPGGSDYTAWSLAPTATLVDVALFDTCGTQTARVGDRMFDFDTSATVPGTPDIRMRTSGCVLTGPGDMYSVGGLNELSIELSSDGHFGGPGSRYLGDLVWDAGANPPILVNHNPALANVSVLMPSDNVSNGGAQSIGLAAVSERYAFDDTGGALNWWIKLIVGDRLRGDYGWRAVVSRQGAATVTSGILQIDDGGGGGWQDILSTKSLDIILTTAQQEIRGSVPDRINLTDRVRMMFRTSVPATGTLVHAFALEATGQP